MKTLILISVFLTCLGKAYSQNKSVNVYNSTLADLSNTIGSFSTEKYCELVVNANSSKYNIKSFNTDDGGNAIYFYQSINKESYSEKSLSYILYPNPTNGIFYIETENSETIDLSIEVLDVSGKIISFYNKAENSTFSIDISNYTKGIYFVKLKNKDNIVMKRLIKL